MSANTETQLELEVLYNKNQLMPRLRDEFASRIDSEHRVWMEKQHELPIEFVVELMAQLGLRKRITYPVLVGLLSRCFNNDIYETTAAIVRAGEIGLYRYDVKRMEFVIVHDIDPCIYQELEAFQYPLPMVVPPKPVERNNDSPLLNGFSGSLILRNNHHNNDINLAHLNRINSIGLRINYETATYVKNSWRNLDKQKEDETKEEFLARKRSFDRYDRSVKRVFHILQQAAENDVIYLTHKYDKRGRTYCQGYHVTYQGNDWCKAIVEFAEGEVTV